MALDALLQAGFFQRLVPLLAERDSMSVLTPGAVSIGVELLATAARLSRSSFTADTGIGPMVESLLHQCVPLVRLALPEWRWRPSKIAVAPLPANDVVAWSSTTFARQAVSLIECLIGGSWYHPLLFAAGVCVGRDQPVD
jgi:hypothetical protein